MSFFDPCKSIIENAYLTSGPIIALFSILILRQLKLAKDQLQISKSQLEENQKQLVISSRRDSIKLAAEQINYFMRDTIPLSNILDDGINSANIKVILIPTTDFKIEDISKTMDVKASADYQDQLTPLIAPFLNVLNSLETFATFFTQEVADERVAFQSVGSTYCYIIRRCSFTLCVLSRANNDRHFSNLIALYQIWSERLERNGLKNEKENLEKEFKEKIQKVDQNLNNKSNREIKPLGSE